ncbi:MAG: alcohol dehydrogenase catalytic domain-containing protein [Chitinivibrionales bacterium]|nr:alcohol dehydrogenase catalytic domain-containing protein [Chitinivibrionales bacterium]
MKAAVFEGIERIVVRDIDTPPCAPDGILVKVEACGICGSDIRNYHAGLKGDVQRQIMGHEFAGTVAEAGPDVTRFSPGDRVAVAPDVSCGACEYCRRGWVNLCVNHRMVGTHWPGGFAEYVHLPAEVLSHGMVHPVPDSLDLIDATMSEPASSVIAAQRNAGVGEGDTVLVIGDGPIGCLHIEVARARGARKVVLAGLTRLKLAAAFEPDLLIDAGSQDTVAETLQATGGLGADIAICANPVAATQEQAVEAVRKRGSVVLFGGLPKTKPMTTLNSNLIHYNELRILGAFSYPAECHREALELIDRGAVSARKYITRQVPLDDIVEGLTAAERGEALKVVVRMSPDTGETHVRHQ